VGNLVGLGKLYTDPKTPAQSRASYAGGARQDAAFAALFHGAVVKLAVLTTNVTGGAVVGGDIIPGTGTAAIYELTQADANAAPVYKLKVIGPVINPFYVRSYLSGSVVSVVDTGRFFAIVTDPSAAGGGAGGSPIAHAATHQNGGTDEVAVAAAAANAIPKAGAGAKLDIGWLPLGSTAATACVGNDARLSDARTPTAHKTSHEPGGTDAMTVDAAAATGSLRTLGTGAAQACAGNDSRLSNNRTPSLLRPYFLAGVA
jgi:hypothetical protein